MNNNNQKPSAKNKRPMTHHANFIEALKANGSSMVQDTVKGFKDDLIKGSVNQMADTLFNPSQPNNNADNDQYDQQPFDFNEYLNSGEEYEKQRQHDMVQREYEQVETVIFNRRQEEVSKRIDEIKFELKRLADNIVGLERSTTTVIEQEIIDPGTYHLSFFEKLLSFIQQMNKRVAESRHWASLHSQRGKSKSYFWKQANKKVGGTKFLLSQERQVATQTG